MNYKMLLLAFICLIAVVPHRANAAKADWQKALLEDAVEVKGDKMTILEFGWLSFPSVPEASMQLKIYSEAPANGVISRDNFVSITSVLQTVSLLDIAVAMGATANENSESLAELFDFAALAEPIENVDLAINIYMHKGGIKMKFTDVRANETERYTMAWKELLGG